MSDPEIRTFAESDRERLRSLFDHAGEDSPTAVLWGDADSEAAVYLDPYMDLEPESLFLAVDDGELVGYLTGCLDGTKLPSESERIDRAIKEHRLVARPKAAAFFARSSLDVALAHVRRDPTATGFDDPRWPAHLHVNVLPRARGIGVGAALMRRWLDRLLAAGSRGCHLQTVVENPRAVRFFERMGFEEHGPTPIVPGLRYRSRRVHQQTMVWSPAPAGRGTTAPATTYADS